MRVDENKECELDNQFGQLFSCVLHFIIANVQCVGSGLDGETGKVQASCNWKGT